MTTLSASIRSLPDALAGDSRYRSPIGAGDWRHDPSDQAGETVTTPPPISQAHGRFKPPLPEPAALPPPQTVTEAPPAPSIDPPPPEPPPDLATLFKAFLQTSLALQDALAAAEQQRVDLIDSRRTTLRGLYKVRASALHTQLAEDSLTEALNAPADPCDDETVAFLNSKMAWQRAKARP